MAEFQRESKTFSQVLNFTRGTTGTYFDSAGVLQTAAVDEPRFTHDPDTLESEGLLIEEQRTNLLLWSEAFDDAVWGKSGATVSANSVNSPNGTLTADTLIEDTSTGGHFIETSGISVTADGVLSSSIFIKNYSGARYAVLRSNQNGNDDWVVINPVTGDITDQGSANISAEVADLQDGFFRISLVYTDTGTGSDGLVVSLSDISTAVDGINEYAGDGTSGIYVWGAQLEEGSFPTSYIKTEGSQVTRSADNCERTLGSEFNASEGRIEVTAMANIGDTVIALGTESIVADVDTEKTYTMTYNTDPSATTLDIMPGATGTVKSVKYSPRETA